MANQRPPGRIKNRLLLLLAEKANREDRGGISLREVSRETGIGVYILSDWSRNAVKKYDTVKLALLCEYFQCSIGDLLVYVPNKKP